MKPTITKATLGIGLLLSAAWSAQAQNAVTFQVDMTQQPTATDVFVRGSFNGYSTANPLANNGSGVYTGTVSIADSPGTVEEYKFFFQPGDNWESPASTCGNNRTFTLAAGVQTLPVVYWNDAPPIAPNNNVTFQVDMTPQVLLGTFVTGSGEVRVSGGFNGWGGGDVLTNNPSASGAATNIFQGTVVVAGVPGACQAYKFRADGGWESPASTAGGNRTFSLAGGNQVLPLVYYNDQSPDAPTNNVTFRVDMTAQTLLGNFIPATGEVRVSGSFNGWGAGDLLTNNPTGNATNVYSTVIPIIAGAGTTVSYKFRMDSGWESPSSTGGGNRTFQIAVGDQVLPLVFYNDASPCDLLQQDTSVTFRLQVTNGTTSADGSITFDRAVNKLYLNGEFLGWWTWNTGFGGSEGPQYELTNNPAGSDFYQQTFTVPRGKTLNMTYKYSIDGFDNEAGFGVNHGRYIRTLSGVPYTMPVDRFGTNQGPPVIEQSFGNLAIRPASAATIPISWLGRQCVTLQTRTNLGVGAWEDLPATEGTSATNWPSSGTSRFFRLKKAP